VPVLPNEYQLAGRGYGHYVDSVGVFKNVVIGNMTATGHADGFAPDGKPGFAVDVFRLFDLPGLRVVGEFKVQKLFNLRG
jgi:hypothetical protein